MKKQNGLIILTCLIIMLFTGCHTQKEESKKAPFLFYVNGEGNALIKKSYTIKADNPKDAVEEVLKELSKAQEKVDIKAPIPQGVEVKEFELKEQNLYLNMNEKYLKMDEVQEVLCRAAIVQSLTQIEGVGQIEFFVNQKPLKTKSGEIIGTLDKDSFVRDTGTALKSYQQATLTLYFANQKGNALLTEKRKVRYLSNVSLEKLVVEQLMKGTEEKGAKEILSPQTKILSVSVKDGICYVNFDKQFLTRVYDVEPQVVIYGIVNSILSNGNVSKVQISVEGKTAVNFQESVKLNEPLDWNLELVESN